MKERNKHRSIQTHQQHHRLVSVTVCTRLHLFDMAFYLPAPLVENYRSHPYRTEITRCCFHFCCWNSVLILYGFLTRLTVAGAGAVVIVVVILYMCRRCAFPFSSLCVCKIQTITVFNTGTQKARKIHKLSTRFKQQRQRDMKEEEEKNNILSHTNTLTHTCTWIKQWQWCRQSTLFAQWRRSIKFFKMHNEIMIIVWIHTLIFNGLSRLCLLFSPFVSHISHLLSRNQRSMLHDKWSNDTDKGNPLTKGNHLVTYSHSENAMQMECQRFLIQTI